MKLVIVVYDDSSACRIDFQVRLLLRSYAQAELAQLVDLTVESCVPVR